MLRDPIAHLVDAYQRCGPVFRLNVLNRSFAVIAGTDANVFMIRHERDYLQNGPIFGGFGAELDMDRAAALLDGDGMHMPACPPIALEDHHVVPVLQ